MKITLQRLGSKNKSTLGVIFIDGVRVGFTVEDVSRETKVAGKTRIPSGTYKIGLNTTGGMNSRYKEKYAFHEGMIEILGIPNFSNVYIHVGNTAEDTEGCPLICYDISHETESGSKSVPAYTAFYKIVILAIKAKESVFINIRDEERIFD